MSVLTKGRWHGLSVRVQHVLAFRVELLDALGRFQGYTTDVERYLPELLDPKKNTFLDREVAERDMGYKQIVPYVVLRHRNAVFSYVRGMSSTESRLRALTSIGLGGHVEPADESWLSSDRDVYLAAARREVNEEVEISGGYSESLVGLINDDSNEVGRVHLGIVHVWDLDGPDVKKREAKIAQTKFLSLLQLRQSYERLETWSQISLRILEDPGVRARLRRAK